MNKVVIAGGSGFLGEAISHALLQKGFEVVILSRSGKASNGARGVTWDAKTVGTWATELEGAKCVLNLTGSSIAQKWTKPVQDEILASRVLSTRGIGQAIAAAQTKPALWINSSAVGYYGNRGDAELTEASDPGPKGHFVVDTAVAWEATVDEFDLPGVRTVKLRTGLPLGLKGGVLPPFLTLTKFFLGGHQGSGDQFMSWIHLDDFVRLVEFLMDHPIEGPVNAVAPNPVSNRYFMAALRGVVGRPWSPPVPAFMLSLANMFGAPDPSLLLEGQRVLPTKVAQAGFDFRFPEIREAFVDLVRKDRGL